MPSKHEIEKTEHRKLTRFYKTLAVLTAIAVATGGTLGILAAYGFLQASNLSTVTIVVSKYGSSTNLPKLEGEARTYLEKNNITDFATSSAAFNSTQARIFIDQRGTQFNATRAAEVAGEPGMESALQTIAENVIVKEIFITE